ncbi:MAG: diaminopimelate epimerase, partial [Armatimonadota bacterium]
MLRFLKMQGAGNDFAVIDCINEELDEASLPNISKCMCDRNFGVGADGLILVLPSRVANFKMRMINPDGSEAEMCGNGIRCFAKFVYDKKMHNDVILTVETLGGIKTLKLNTTGGKVETVRVDMGEPGLLRSQIPMRGSDNSKVIGENLKAAGKKFEITCVSMGNPHCVIFTDDLEYFPIEKYGPEIENHASFPQRTNVEFVEVINQQEIKMRVWERGAGET